MADNLYGSICLSDIPKELIQTGKNGKKYLQIVVNKRREVGQYGHTHYIKAYAKKGTVNPEMNLYIGELKPSDYNNQQGAAPTSGNNGFPPPPEDEDLPF